MKIKNIEFNSDLIGYVVTLEDGREFNAQADREANRLHADFGTYSLCEYEPDICDAFSNEEKQQIMSHLNSLEEVKEWLESLENWIN